MGILVLALYWPMGVRMLSFYSSWVILLWRGRNRGRRSCQRPKAAQPTQISPRQPHRVIQRKGESKGQHDGGPKSIQETIGRYERLSRPGKTTASAFRREEAEKGRDGRRWWRQAQEVQQRCRRQPRRDRGRARCVVIFTQRVDGTDIF
jgi:hypothetical protein